MEPEWDGDEDGEGEGDDEDEDEDLGMSRPIDLAIWEGDCERVRTLIKENPALLDAYNEVNSNPLDSAIKFFACCGKLPAQTLEMVRCLIELGANVNAIDDQGFVALHSVANIDFVELAVILIEAGADVNIKDPCGRSPLYFSVASQSLEVSRVLMEYGAHLEDHPIVDGPSLSECLREKVKRYSPDHFGKKVLSFMIQALEAQKEKNILTAAVPLSDLGQKESKNQKLKKGRPL